MAKIFYLHEIVKFAIEREQQSFDLYTKLANLDAMAKEKDLFAKLAQEEKKHKIFYEQMMTTIKNEQSPKVHEDDEYDAYMKELIDSERRTQQLENITTMSRFDILAYAIAREKDSILFYVGLKNCVPEKAREHVDTIIKEEMRHVAILTKVQSA
jgi:rubrerythrin